MAAKVCLPFDTPDGYFTLINDPKYNNVKMCMLPRWQQPQPDGMGMSIWSKTLKIADYDGEEMIANLVYLVADSWKLWRASHGAFLKLLPARFTWYCNELDRLRHKIQALGVAGGGTGNAEVDNAILAWAPAALAQDEGK